MGWHHVFEVLGGLVMMYFGWQGLAMTAKSSMRAPEGAVMWLFGFLLTGAATVGGALIAYNSGKQGYEDHLYKEKLREHIVQTHTAAVLEYARTLDQFEKLSPQQKAKNAPALARLKAYVDKGTEQDLELIDEYTAESLRKYGTTDVRLLEKEITIASMKASVEKFIEQAKQ